MAADALAPPVTRPSAAMVLYDKRISVVLEEGYLYLHQLSVKPLPEPMLTQIFDAIWRH